MDQLSQEELNRITAIPADSLTPQEKAFLYARREYLTREQKNAYKGVIKAEDQRVADEANQEEA